MNRAPRPPCPSPPSRCADRGRSAGRRRRGLQRWNLRRNAAADHKVCSGVPLFNFELPATELEIRDAALQFVRKLSGFNAPSKANEVAFECAVQDVAASACTLMRSRAQRGGLPAIRSGAAVTSEGDGLWAPRPSLATRRRGRTTAFRRYGTNLWAA